MIGAPKNKQIQVLDENGNTPLHMAILKIDIPQVIDLLESKVDVNVENNAGYTAIDFAKNIGDLAILKVLHQYGCLNDEKIAEKLLVLENLNGKITKVCNSFFGDTEFSSEFSCYLKVFSDKEKVLKTLELMEDSYTLVALQNATNCEKFLYLYWKANVIDKQGMKNITELLKQMANDNYFWKSPSILPYDAMDWSLFQTMMIDFFINANDETIYKLLVGLSKSKHRNFNENDNLWGNTALHFWISNGQFDSAAKFIQMLCSIDNETHCGLNVNVLSREFGNAPLHLCIAKGYINADAYKSTVNLSYLSLAKILLEAGAEVNLPIQSSAKEGGNYKEIIKSDKFIGQTPLHLACARRDFDMVKLLLEHNADQSLLNSQEQTAIEVLNLPYIDRKEMIDSISGEINDFNLQQEWRGLNRNDSEKDNLDIFNKLFRDYDKTHTPKWV